MDVLITLLLCICNACLAAGVAFGVLVLLRPLLVPLVTPQQRVWMWYLFWYSIPFLSVWDILAYPGFRILPITVWDLLGVPSSESPRTLFGAPAFLPGRYGGPGIYHLTLPGGRQIPVELTDGYLSVIDSVEEKVYNLLTDESGGKLNVQRMFPHRYWREKKRFLKLAGIDWRTPSELNPGVRF